MKENSQECASHNFDDQYILDREFIKSCYKVLLVLAHNFKRGQFIVNSSMVFILKYIRIYNHNEINKYLLCVSSFVLAAKSRDEPLPLNPVAIFLRKITNPLAKNRVSNWEKENLKNQICDMEYSILCELGFDVDLELPNIHIASMCEGAHHDVEKYAYMFLNDSF